MPSSSNPHPIIKNADTRMGICIRPHFDCTISSIIDHCSHPDGCTQRSMDSPTDLKTCHRHVFCPTFGGAVLFESLYSMIKNADTRMGICIFALKYIVLTSSQLIAVHILADAPSDQWILPRAKKCPPDTFCTSVRTGAALSNPSHPLPIKKTRCASSGLLYWQRMRDSNSGISVH